MHKGFWDTLPRPFFVLAPLADVTDAAFRRVIAKYSKPSGPHAMWTEFVSADGLVRADEMGRAKLMRDLVFSEAERPIVAQFFTSTPEHMEKAAAVARELGFNGVDINMGCPDRSIEKQEAGAALIKNPKRAHELVHAAKVGAGGLPVSVKTRLGFNTDILEEWLPALLEAKPAAITLHARTRKEMSKVPAHWERVRDAVALRDKYQGSTLMKTFIVGNGDAMSLTEAEQKVRETGCDGVMLGRAIFGNPWLWSERIPSREERLRVMVEHTKLFEELLGDIKSFAIMKKHYKAYIHEFDGAKELREKLMECSNADEVKRVVNTFHSNSPQSTVANELTRV